MSIPYETGMVSDCKTLYLVPCSDTRTGILASHGITVADFGARNADVRLSSTSIWLGYHTYVGIVIHVLT